ncbi:MAG: ATP-binding cassette domain-containing protein [Actinobacteria bacterium]|nr:ATP-binding cassette domain-containing protein [Actinomycetota bacterium]
MEQSRGIADSRKAREPVLAVENLTVVYKGGGIGVEGISLQIGSSQVVTLLGPNGAGKTSTLRGIAGFLRRDAARATSGSIKLNGKELSKMSPGERAREGIAMVPERDKVFTGLSVMENLKIGAVGRGKKKFQESMEKALAIFPNLVPHLNRKAGYLSGGQRQMLALASALCTDPKLLVVDELTLGLSPELVATMVRSLAEIVAEGLPILAAEQSISVALDLSDVIHVLDGGKQVTSGDKEALMTDKALVETFLGRTTGAPVEERLDERSAKP